MLAKISLVPRPSITANTVEGYASLVPRPSITANTVEGYASLVPRPSITANVVEGLVKLLRRMTSGGRLLTSFYVGVLPGLPLVSCPDPPRMCEKEGLVF